MRNPAWLLGGLMVAVSGFTEAEADSLPLYETRFSLVGDFTLGSATNRVDYLSLDPDVHRLFIAKMGAGEVLAFDTAQKKIVAKAGNLPKVTGVLAVPALHRVYASVPGAGLASSMIAALGMAGLSSGHGAVVVLTEDLKEIARLPGGVFPDGIAYDPVDRKIFVSDELGSAITAIDTGTDRVVGRIKAGGEVGNVQFDSATGRIYAPIQSRNELVILDPASNSIIARHPLTGCDHPHGLAIASGAAIGYVACDGNDRLLTVDLRTGAIIDRKPLVHDPDVLAIDSAKQRLYVASESGGLSSFDIGNPAAPETLGDVFVAPDAHSVAVNSATHELYFPLADLDEKCVVRVLSPK